MNGGCSASIPLRQAIMPQGFPIHGIRNNGRKLRDSWYKMFGDAFADDVRNAFVAKNTPINFFIATKRSIFVGDLVGTRASPPASYGGDRCSSG